MQHASPTLQEPQSEEYILNHRKLVHEKEAIYTSSTQTTTQNVCSNSQPTNIQGAMGVFNSFRVLVLALVGVFAIYYFSARVNESVDRIVRRGYKPPNRCVDSGVIALTFDHGVSKDYTPAILNELSKVGIKATFHVDTTYLNDQVVTGIISRMKSDGHEIGIVYKGPAPSTVKREEILAVLRTQVASMQAAVQVTPRFVRFPYQSTTAEIDDYINQNGFTQTSYTIDAGNSALCKSPKELGDSINSVYKTRLDQFNAIGGGYKGSLIGLHTDLCSEAQGLGTLLPLIKDKYGYQFITLNACLNGLGSGTNSNDNSSNNGGSNSNNGMNTNSNNTKKNAAQRATLLDSSIKYSALAALVLEVILFAF